MRIDWSPIKLDFNAPVTAQIPIILEDVKEEQRQQDEYYRDTAESMDRLEQQQRETLLTFITGYSDTWHIRDYPDKTFHVSKYLAGTYIITK